MAKRTGRKGSDEHEAMVDVVRCCLMPRMVSKHKEPVGCIAADVVMGLMLGANTHGKEGTCPDAVLWRGQSDKQDDGEMVVVEIGAMRGGSGRWGEEQPVLHLNMDGTVSMINGKGTRFEGEILAEMRDLMKLAGLIGIEATIETANHCLALGAIV